MAGKGICQFLARALAGGVRLGRLPWAGAFIFPLSRFGQGPKLYAPTLAGPGTLVVHGAAIFLRNAFGGFWHRKNSINQGQNRGGRAERHRKFRLAPA